MYQQQMWALRRANEGSARKRTDEASAEKQRRDDFTEKQRRDGGDQIDPERYRADPDYRRQAQQSQAYKSSYEKQRDRENDVRAFIERGGRE